MDVTVTWLGLNEQVTPEGCPEQARLTGPVNPFWGVMVMVDVVLAPADTLAGLRTLAPTVKDGAMTVKLVLAGLDRSPEVPVTLTEAVPPGVLDAV